METGQAIATHAGRQKGTHPDELRMDLVLAIASDRTQFRATAQRISEMLQEQDKLVSRIVTASGHLSGANLLLRTA